MALSTDAARDPDQLRRDRRYMMRALRLAQRGFTPPNPMVGCVLVRDCQIVGEGWHTQAGRPHAEVEALRAAGEAARGSTAYVTLEPCSHYGRTPPCTEALIAAGVARVVAATTDVEMRGPGKGLRQLEQAGVSVTCGLLEAGARRVNEAFFHYHATGLPFVTMKAAQTLDGKIATRTGDSKWISGERSRRYVHALRARSGAVLVGIGTLLADDAELTARTAPPSPRQPLRIVVDTHLRTPPGCRAVCAASAHAPLLVACGVAAPLAAERALARDGVEILRLPASADGVDLAALMRTLGKREIVSVLAEGGGAIHAALLAAGLVSKLLLFIAPKIAGGAQAPTAVEGEGVASMADALPARFETIRRIDGDLLLEAYL